MVKEKDRLFAVFGLGTFGLEVCKVLSGKGAKVIAVDKDQKLINRVKDLVSQAILIDSSDEVALKNANLQDVDVAIIAIGESIAGSILTTILLKKLGVPYIISRAVSEVHAEALKQIGATEVINIAVEEGQRLAKRVISPNMVDMIPISKGQSIGELHIPQSFVDKTLQDINLRKKYHVNLVSIKRTTTEIDNMGNPKREETVISPNPDEKLKINDTLVVLGSEKNIENLREL